MDASLATELLQLASRLRSVHEMLGAREIEAVVRKHCPAALPPRRDRRPIVATTVFFVGGKPVREQVSRRPFAIG